MRMVNGSSENGAQGQAPTGQIGNEDKKEIENASNFRKKKKLTHNFKPEIHNYKIT